MEKIVSEGYGSQIIERDGKVFICFDEGHFNVKWAEYEIKKDEIEKAMKSEQDNYQVCLAAQTRNLKHPL